MSYTGFFAETDLYEVAKGGDPSKGSWVVPVERADGISQDDFVRVEDEVTGEKKAVIHRRGTFVFRLAGRERQQSASYYTPEVLTRFTVSQALEELLDQDGHTTTAEEILGLTVCEPALGSGAFAIEAVRQLAEQYLRRRQAELGERIDPDKYPTELQRVKASIALHQVYGVDLNATAVELAEISLWLDTMVSGLQAPWFGLRLRRGNSLIGARRAVYTRAQVNDKSWLKATPTDVPMTGMVEEMANETTAKQTDGRIHHFLLPASGWGSAVVEAKEAVGLAPEAAAALKKWRSAITSKPTPEATQRPGRTGAPGRGAVATDAAPAADRRVGGPARHPAVGPRRSGPHPGGHPGGDREDPRASRTVRTSDCGGSWTPGPRSGSGRSPTPAARSRPPWTSGSRHARHSSAANPRPARTTNGMTPLRRGHQLGRPERRRGPQPRLRRRGQRRRRA